MLCSIGSNKLTIGWQLRESFCIKWTGTTRSWRFGWVLCLSGYWPGEFWSGEWRPRGVWSCRRGQGYGRLSDVFRFCRGWIRRNSCLRSWRRARRADAAVDGDTKGGGSVQCEDGHGDSQNAWPRVCKPPEHHRFSVHLVPRHWVDFDVEHESAFQTIAPHVCCRNRVAKKSCHDEICSEGAGTQIVACHCPRLGRRTIYTWMPQRRCRPWLWT